MTDSLPVLRIPGTLRDALDVTVLAQLDTAALARFLGARRWFGAKGRTTRTARVRDLVSLPWEDTCVALARLDVTFDDGTARTYQLPLSARRGAPGEVGTPRTPIAILEAKEERGVLFDATEDATFRRRLGEALASGATFEQGGVRWCLLPLETAARELRGAGDTRLGGAEQSNTSIVYGERAILKLFRVLERGVHPDVEIARFLARGEGFAHTPPFLGAIEVEDAEGRSTAGMLQGFLPGSVDAWSWILDQGRQFFTAPGEETPRNPLVPELERLGRVTRRLHEALAEGDDEPDFAPTAVEPEHVERWIAAARKSIETGLALLGERLAAGAVPADRVSEATALVGRRDAFLAHVDEVADRIGDEAGEMIRHHGDFHLGQVLRTTNGDFHIIDFEGEPARPLAARRERTSALRDVAGMLRSFAYAAATLASAQRQRLEPRILEPRTARWERAAREAFLAGYLGPDEGEDATFLPDSREGIDAVTTLFETEKVFYELAYELNNRPEWVWIPLRGVSRLLYR